MIDSSGTNQDKESCISGNLSFRKIRPPDNGGFYRQRRECQYRRKTKDMVKTIRLEGREKDLKRLILAFQERKPEWVAWICLGCNSEYKELQDILKENGGKAQRRRTGSERSPYCEGEDCE